MYEKGKLYSYTAGHTSEQNLHAKPDMYSKVLGSVRKDAVLMILDILDQVNPQMDSPESYRFIQVISGDVVGWLACYYRYEFQANKFLKPFHH